MRFFRVTILLYICISSQTHKLSQMKSKQKKVDEVNAQIQMVFTKNDVTVDIGEESFWNGVEDVEAINPKDGVKLRNLASKWECLQKEQIKK
jgi:hypothetical protein